jgi:FKBP-type peptidyl-prolyl cis-trans isomerase SlyD
MDIRKNRVATLHYTLRDDDGVVLETTLEKIPLSYIHGHEQILSGIEEAVKGKKPGDKISLTIPSEQAYGERDESLTSVLPVAVFQGVDEIRPGMRFEMPHDEGVHVATVIEVMGRDVKIDNNHPLAGKNLHAEIEIVDVREPTPEERETGEARQMYELIDE